ncbi:MAG: aldo/keto reductase [Actinomycetaceae bacterium]|nr:aldo/keto reductase [Actinomycetaceae bacterium]
MADIPMLALLDGGQIPAAGLGTWTHRGREGAKLFTKAIEDGHRLIDTAMQYGNEAAVGQAVKDSTVAREDIFITTKIAGGDQGKGATRLGLEASLRHLDTDYVDLTLIHWPNPSRGLYLETWEELITLKEEGLTHHIGVSNFLPDQILELEETTGVLPVLNQIQLSPIIGQVEWRRFHDEKGIITEAWRPLGPKENLLGQILVQNIARDTGKTPAQVVMRWAVQHGILPIAVSSKPERNLENIQIFDFELSDAQMLALDLLDTGERFALDPMIHEEW